MMIRLFFSATLLATLASSAFAQDSTSRSAEIPHNSARSASDSSAPPRHNWFASLIRKIARQSEEPAATPATPVARDTAMARDTAVASEGTVARNFKSRKDSIGWENARSVADRAEGYRIVVDLLNREMHVIDHADTIRTASVATAMRTSLAYGNRV